MSTSRDRRRVGGVDQPVEHNLRVLTGGAVEQLPPSPLEMEREVGLRFVMRVRGRASAARVRNAIQRAHGLHTRVKSFPQADAPWTDDERRFVITIQGIAPADIPENPFDLKRRLAQTEGLDVALCEPDIPSALTTGNAAATGATLAGIPFCNVDEEPDLPITWHLDAMRIPGAWQLESSDGGRRFGEGILVGHPDTGWVKHDEMDATALVAELGYDFVDEDKNARDPLEQGPLGIGLLAQPGHGLGTGVPIISSHPIGQLNGVAPAAELVPIRTTKRVWQVLTSNIARAIDHAVAQGCHVISISLGGFALFHLEEALNDAVANNVIVCAAAGNCIHVVPFPAAYRNCVAVAASDSADRAWRGSSRGPAVDIAAPGVNIWVARRRRGERNLARIGQSQGASPATAATSGVAALWLAYHGRDALLERYEGRAYLQHVFVHLLRQTARTPHGWDSTQHGAGIVDAEALLKAPLPTTDEVVAGLPPEPLAPTPPDEVIAAMTGLTREEVRQRLGSAMPSVAATDAAFDATLADHGQELAYLLAADRGAFAEFVGTQNAGALASRPGREVGQPPVWLRRASNELRERSLR